MPRRKATSIFIKFTIKGVISIIADILHKICSMKFEDEEKKTYHPRPSLAGPQRCLRQMVYMSRHEPAKKLLGRTLVVFDDGIWHEELTLNLLRQSVFTPHSEQMGITIPEALSFMPEGAWKCGVCEQTINSRDFHGHIDALIVDPLGVDRLIEAKALSHFGTEGILKGELPFDYFAQMSAYMRGLQQDNPDLKEGLLLIKNKNNGGYVEFICSYDTASDIFIVMSRTDHNGERADIGLTILNATRDIFARFAAVEKHRKEGTLPEREYPIDHWRCQYCAFPQCWDGWVQEHAALAEDAALEDEVVNMLRYEREVALHESSAKKERDEIKEKIKEFLKDKGIRSGRAGGYCVTWTVEKQKRFNKELLPPGVYACAMEDVPVEKLSIRKDKKETP